MVGNFGTGIVNFNRRNCRHLKGLSPMLTGLLNYSVTPFFQEKINQFKGRFAKVLVGTSDESMADLVNSFGFPARMLDACGEAFENKAQKVFADIELYKTPMRTACALHGITVQDWETISMFLTADDALKVTAPKDLVKLRGCGHPVAATKVDEAKLPVIETPVVEKKKKEIVIDETVEQVELKPLRTAPVATKEIDDDEDDVQPPPVPEKKVVKIDRVDRTKEPIKAEKPAQKAVKKPENDDDDENEPIVKKAPAKKEPVKKIKKDTIEMELPDDDDDDAPVPPKPVPTKKVEAKKPEVSKPALKIVPKEEDDEDEEYVKPVVKKVVNKAPASVDDDNDEDEVATPRSKSTKPVVKKKTTNKYEDDEDDDFVFESGDIDDEN